MATVRKIAPCLWFDGRAEDAAKFYTGVFKGSKLGNVSRYTDVGQDITKQKPGTVLTVDFEILGQPFTALNGGPLFKFNEAISFQVYCKDQKEIDYYWETLGAGGDPKSQQCGWLKDKFGVSWQIVPEMMAKLMADSESAGTKRAMAAMFKMKKLDIAALEKAYAG